MERERFNLLTTLLRSRRVVEWTIIIAVLIGLVWALEHQVRVVQGQAERVAVRATLASLKAALAIDQLMGQVRPVTAGLAVAPKNPFALLQGVPPNFAGEHPLRDIYTVPPGSWVFDSECGCVGYRLLYPRWLEPVQVADAIWFRVGSVVGDARLSPLADYRWLGQSLN